MSTFTYRLQSIEAGFLAECCELEVAGEGLTRETAIESLREALAATLAEPNAVAPPATTRAVHVTLSEAAARPPESRQGPGEAEAPRSN